MQGEHKAAKLNCHDRKDDVQYFLLSTNTDALFPFRGGLKHVRKEVFLLLGLHILFMYMQYYEYCHSQRDSRPPDSQENPTDKNSPEIQAQLQVTPPYNTICIGFGA